MQIFDSWIYMLVLGVALIFLCLVAPPLLAARKGYAWYLWTFACGLLGLLVLAFLPYANERNESEEVNRARRKTGNIVGAVLTGIGVLGICMQGLLVLIAVMARQSRY